MARKSSRGKKSVNYADDFVEQQNVQQDDGDSEFHPEDEDERPKPAKRQSQRQSKGKKRQRSESENSDDLDDEVVSDEDIPKAKKLDRRGAQASGKVEKQVHAPKGSETALAEHLSTLTFLQPPHTIPGRSRATVVLKSKDAGGLYPVKGTNLGLSTPHLTNFGPIYYPPLKRRLGEWGGNIILEEHNEDGRLDAQSFFQLATAWSNHPFAPTRDLTQDLGWDKSKWTSDGLERGWGGFSSKLQSSEGWEIMRTQEELEKYLPHQVYRSLRECAEPPVTLPNNLEGVTLEQWVENEGDLEDFIEPSGDNDDTIEEEEKISVWMGVPDPAADPENLRQQLVTFGRWDSARLDAYIPKKPGWIFNTGACVTSVAWCPLPDQDVAPKVEYLLVATQSTVNKLSPTPTALGLLQLWCLPSSTPSDFSPETHNSEQGAQMTLELGIALQDVEGEPYKISWRCFGKNEERKGLGMVAVTWTDGCTHLFNIPSPVDVKARTKSKEGESIFVKVKPILSLRIDDAKSLCLDWASNDTLAIGLTNGWVAIFQISALLEHKPSPLSVPLPSHYIAVHQGPIRGIRWQKYPDVTSDGRELLNHNPMTLVTVSTDGTHRMIDIRDPVPVPLFIERTTPYSAGSSTWLGGPIFDDADQNARHVSIRPAHFVLTRLLMSNRGVIWDISTSNHQPFVAAASADGTLSIVNGLRDLKRHHHVLRFVRKIYRIDFNRLSGEYRMLDNILPEERPHPRPSVPKGKKNKKEEESKEQRFQDAKSTGAWPEQIGIMSCEWHPSIRKFGLVASGMACGLVRVDWTEI